MEIGVEKVELDDLLARADIISLHAMCFADKPLHDLLSAYGAITARRSRSVHVVRRRPVMALDEAIERLEHLLGRSNDWTELVRFLPADLADES